MRWVKAVVIIAIVAAIIPTMIMIINRLPSEYTTERVEYEITITKDNITETVYELYNRVKLDDPNIFGNRYVTNWLYVKRDGKTAEVSNIWYEPDDNRFVIRYYESHYTSPGYVNMYLDLDDPIGGSNFYGANTLTIGLYDEIVVESISSLELILISLTPLILISGLLIYQYKELGLNKNE